jgi:hypothetical protein
LDNVANLRAKLSHVFAVACALVTVSRLVKRASRFRQLFGNQCEFTATHIFTCRNLYPQIINFTLDHPTPSEILHSLIANWRLIVLGILTVMMTTVSFYYITAYTPTFGRQVLKLAPGDNLLVTMCVGFSNLVWQLISGTVSDRIGRRPIGRARFADSMRNDVSTLKRRQKCTARGE